jgi:hypothetical protein
VSWIEHSFGKSQQILCPRSRCWGGGAKRRRIRHDGTTQPMKPSIFIVHWTNTAGLAEAVKGALEPRYNVHLGDRPAEATSSEAWAILAQTLPWFDFAILIPAAAEVLPFPKTRPAPALSAAFFWEHWALSGSS